MKKFIEEKMIEHFRTCSVDRYGQVGVINPYLVFNEKTKEVIEYLKGDPFIVVNTYGDRFGVYQGISSSHDIIDKELRSKCYSALNENKSYKWAMSH